MEGCRRENIYHRAICGAGRGISYAVMIGKVTEALKGYVGPGVIRDICALILGKEQ